MLVEVALPVPVPRTFTYRAPDGTTAGVRVRVPFARRKLIGWIVGQGGATPELDRLLDVDRVLDDAEPSLTPELLRLCRWIADYYVTPLGIVIRAALPAVLSQLSRAAPPARTVRVLRLTRELPSLSQRDEIFGRARRQRECYEALEAAGGESDVPHLTEQLSFTTDVLRRLVARGLAEFVERRVDRDPFALFENLPQTRFTLTAAQEAAVRAIVAAARLRAPAADTTEGARDSALKPFLLMGVTGSGKTLVYIELLEEVVRRQGRGAIVLVPEIALTPQTVSRFRSHFGDAVAVLHSALSEGERYDAWRALRYGEKRIAIGARSAIFAPIPQLGAIVVDEEHESTYKQSDAPRYHAREIAVVRARLAGAVCVLGSATPALESYHNTRLGKYTLLELPERVAGRPLPVVTIVDVRKQPPRAKGEGARERAILSTSLTEAIHERLARNEQTILLLNRRGYATFVQCRACGAVWQCQQCNVSLTYHRARRRLVCHYCFHEEHPPTHCDRCGSGDLSFRGVGTEQVEREVADTFPTARLARMDVDTTSAKWSHHEILTRVERREVDILLGTQMIAKGLDFPGVTLVGVVNADVAMNLPDFRASERTFQLLTQVAGRAGRGDDVGIVIVQTALPQHYAIRCALDHDYVGFAERELKERSGPAYPPHTRLANVVLSGIDERIVQDAAAEAAAWVDELLARMRSRAVQLTGPAPCAIDRIRGRWRWHFLLRSRQPAPLGSACRLLQTRYRPPKKAELRLVIDRDPVSLL
jgi:primosomal protein N' (replication factor Y)